MSNATLLQLLSAAVIFLAVLFLIGLGVVCIVRPALAARFLLAFASTAKLHLLELAGRFVVGVALVCHSEATTYPVAFAAVGWALLVTTAVLLVLPWRLHRAFAAKVVPPALKFVQPMGVVAVVMGMTLLLVH